MPAFNKSQRILFLYGIFVAMAAAWVLGIMLSSPSERAHALAFGLSTPRLLLTLGLLAALALFLLLGLKAFRDRTWAEHFVDRWFGGKGLSRGFIGLSGISLGLGWIGSFLPTYRMGAWANYAARVQPVIVFILFASLATLVVFCLVRIQNWNLAALRLGLPLFVTSLLILGFLFYSGFGVVSSEDFWYGAGVPILASQLIAGISGGILFLHFGPRWTSKRADILIGVAIYAITAWWWVRAPLQKSFLMTGPYLPNRVFYPFADAAVFDTASQFALIGQKISIFNTLFFERPVYLSFLVYLHTLVGQDYLKLMAIQAGIFAIMPVLIYLIGRSLNMRVIGFSAALMALFRGLNAIAASNLIDTAGPKMILTDFPTAIGLALITLLTCEWLKDPERKPHYAVWVGGGVGLALMLRTNALILLAFIPLYAFLVFAIRKRRQWILGSALILLGAIAITLPWELRNWSLGGQMYRPIVTKLQAVIQQRYPTQPAPGSFSPLDQKFAAVVLNNTRAVTVLQQNKTASQNTPACEAVLCFTTNHFLHNAITSILALPTSPMLDDLRHLIKERSPYWQTRWDGRLSRSAAFLLILNVFFIATGIALAWREKRFLGLTPLAIFIAYNLSNALARTSGGRYLVPVDWLLLFYDLLGVFHVITWLANTLDIDWKILSAPSGSPAAKTGAFSLKALGAFTTLFLFGALLPLSEHLHGPRYQDQDPQATLTNSSTFLEQAGFSREALKLFQQNPDAKILIGRALYPRYYEEHRGEFENAFFPYQTLGFPRIAFRLIGPAGEYGVVLPIEDVPNYFPHTGDMLVLGCNGPDYLDALLVIGLDDRQMVYTRKPAPSTLACPLPQPVCDNNSNCQ